MACVGGLGQFEFRFAAEFIEVSLAPQKGRPAQIPKHGGISQNARQPREQCRSELYGKRRDRRMRDAPLDGSRACIKIWEKRAQYPSDDGMFEIASDWLPGLNQQ